MAKNKSAKKPKQNKKSSGNEDESQRLGMDDNFTAIPGNGSKALNRNNMPKR